MLMARSYSGSVIIHRPKTRAHVAFFEEGSNWKRPSSEPELTFWPSGGCEYTPIRIQLSPTSAVLLSEGSEWLYFAHYNFVRIHGTLRVTPAMAANVTDHLWTIEELLNAGA